jgi:septal ring factor EnvC (AmiA/AmiB activator)
VLGAGAVAHHAWTSTQASTDRTETALHQTRTELSHTRQDLADATDELDTTRATLGDDFATLATRIDERATAQDGLDLVNQLRADAEARLNASRTDLQTRQVRLDALDRCLTGVAAALNQAAVNDNRGLASTLRSIEGVCSQAGVGL